MMTRSFPRQPARQVRAFDDIGFFIFYILLISFFDILSEQDAHTGNAKWHFSLHHISLRRLAIAGKATIHIAHACRLRGIFTKRVVNFTALTDSRRDYYHHAFLVKKSSLRRHIGPPCFALGHAPYCWAPRPKAIITGRWWRGFLELTRARRLARQLFSVSSILFPRPRPTPPHARCFTSLIR